MHDIDYKELTTLYAREKIEADSKSLRIERSPEEFRYVIYARKSNKNEKMRSGEDQVLNSIERQIKECQNSFKNLNIVAEFYEVVSARKSNSNKREEFSKMIKGFKTGEYDGLIALMPDRLSRNMKDAGEIIDLLDSNKIKDLRFSRYTFTNDTNGKMALGIQFVLAKTYSDNTSEHQKSTNESLIKKGKVARNYKLGYKLKEKSHIPDPPHFETIQEAFKMSLQGKTLNEIASYMNSKRIGLYEESKKQYKTKVITNQRASSILNDTFYTGLLVYNSQIVDLTSNKFKNLFVPAVSFEDFIKSKEKRDPNKYHSRKLKRASTTALRGLCICAYCNKAMAVYKSKGQSQVRFLRAECKTKDCQRSKAVKIAREEDGIKYTVSVRARIILDHLAELLNKSSLDDVKLLDSLKAIALKELKNKLSSAESCYTRLEEEIIQMTTNLSDNQNLRASLDDNDPSKKYLIQQINQLAREIDESTKELNNCERKIINYKELIKNSSDLVNSKNVSNIFKKSALMLQSEPQEHLIQQILKTFFSNITLDARGIASVKVKHPYDLAIKTRDSLMVGRQRLEL